MYKIIIADEDLYNVKNFKSYINLNFKNFKIIKVITKYNDKFLNFISNNNLNLIIGDVRFFGNNPYKNLEDIYRKITNINFLLYGSINDVEYLNKTLEIGNINYMIKPIRPSDLNKNLIIVEEKLKKEKIEKEEFEKIYIEYKNNINIFENYFFFNLINGNLKDENEILNSFKYFNINLEKNYVSLIFNISQFKKMLLILNEEEKHLLSYKILYIIKNEISNITNISKLNNFDSLVVILGGNFSIKDIIKLCENIKYKIKSKFKVDLNISIGRIYEEAINIATSYKEAKYALEHKFYMGTNTIIPIDYVEPSNIITFKYNIEYEKNLIRKVVIGDIKSCKILLNKIFNCLREISFLPDKLIYKIIINILTSINRFISEQDILKNTDIFSFFKIEDVIKIKTIDEGYLYLYYIIENFCNYVIEKRKLHEKNIIENAKKYIKEKYYEQISLNKLSTHIGITPDYLNKLFLNYEKTTYYDYVVNRRLSVAKKLLKETDLNDDIIAINVGYDDVRHFRSIFKKYENINIDEFKKKQNKYKL